MKPCNHKVTLVPKGLQFPLQLFCALAQGHTGDHCATFTFNGIYAEAEWPEDATERDI